MGAYNPPAVKTDIHSTERVPAWDAGTLRDPHGRDDKAVRVQAMFDAIARTYERVNAVVSLGQDGRWRRRAVRCADVRPGDVVLDVCCGTGDMIRTFAAGTAKPGLIVGVDFAEKMLACGRYPSGGPPIQLVRADAQRLPLPDASVDVVSCAFGVRNFQSLDAGLSELARVLRPGGRCVVLEFALPENAILRVGHRAYCDRVLPLVARWISGDRSGAYQYLPRSIRTFERRGAMVERLERTGLRSVTAIPLNLGSVAIYRGEK